MTPEQFRAWRKREGLSQTAAATALGVSMTTVRLYEKGERWEDGRPVVIPKSVRLACAAISLGMKDYDG